MKKPDPHDRDRELLKEVKTRVLFHAKPPVPRPKFLTTRWPYTYAADFVRAHEGVIPDTIWDKLEVGAAGSISRAQASRARTVWANSLGVLDVDVAELFACGYLIENEIDITDADARRLVPTWVRSYPVTAGEVASQRTVSTP